MEKVEKFKEQMQNAFSGFAYKGVEKAQQLRGTIEEAKEAKEEQMQELEDAGKEEGKRYAALEEQVDALQEIIDELEQIECSLETADIEDLL